MFLMNANQLANASSKNNALFLFLGLMVVAFLLVPDQAHAGTGGTAFDDVWVTLKDWTQGTLGRIVAGAMILVGVVGGIARQ
ncbi:TraA family conjugative transfer protein, partial [Escherichia coli]